MFCSQDNQVFVFLTISRFTKSVISWWVLLHVKVCLFEYIFWTTTHSVIELSQLTDIKKGNNFQESFEQFWGLGLKWMGLFLSKMDGSVLEEKSSFNMLGLTFSSKLNWGFYIISTAKINSKKTGALIRSMKFLSPEVALYLYKSTIWLCMEYCCDVWAGAPSYYLELLDKL